MTADGLAGEQGSRARPLRGPASVSTSAILTLCDRLLDEIGRRSHLFSWLRPPGTVDGWLAVDAYYPGNRLVVICRAGPADHEELYAELVPAHGLRLLRVAPGELGPDLGAAKLALQRKLAELGPAPPRPTGPPVERHRPPPTRTADDPPVREAPAPQPPRRVGRAQAAAAERAARFVAAHRPDAAHAPTSAPPRELPPRDWSRIQPRHRDPPAPRTSAAARRRRTDGTTPVGLALGVTLAVLVAAELYVAVVAIALGAGELLLAVVLILDACARAVGTLAAARAGLEYWAWGCAIIGSPVVVAFALKHRR